MLRSFFSNVVRTLAINGGIVVISKLLGIIGLILTLIIFLLGRVSYEIIQQALNELPSIRYDESSQIIIYMSFSMFNLFLLIPGLVLLWMSEIGHEVRKITKNSQDIVK